MVETSFNLGISDCKLKPVLCFIPYLVGLENKSKVVYRYIYV